MDLHLQYVTNDKGGDTSGCYTSQRVGSFQKEYNKLKKKPDILLGIENALEEVDMIQSGKKKEKSLTTFIDEL